MKMRQILSSLACGAIILTGPAACTKDSDNSEVKRTNAQRTAEAPKDAATLVQTGIEQGQAGDLDAAKATFEQVVGMDQGNKFAWFNLGYIAQSRGQADEAVTNYDRALEVDPSFKPALFNKAIVLESRDQEASVKLYRQILTMDSKASTTHFRLGLLLVRAGDKAEAKRQFAAAVKIDGDLAKAVPAGYLAKPSASPSASAEKAGGR